MSDSSNDFTPKLALPFLLPAQAQKHVTVNETLGALDALVMGAVIAADQSAPPSDPESGDAYIVASGASGDWSGEDGKLAVWADGVWTFRAPQPGWRFWSASSERLVIYDGQDWVEIAPIDPEFQNLPQVGIAATADANNRLSVRAPGALFTALESASGGSGDVRVSVNAEAPGNVASVVFQKGYSGRAEIGLTASDTFALRTSADGSIWVDALVVDPASGHIGIGHAPSASDALSLSAPMTIGDADSMFSFSDNGVLDMYNDTGGIYIRSRSPGQYLRFGATQTDGTIISDAFYIRPNPEDIILTMDLSPETADSVDLGTPVRPFRNLYLTNTPIVSSDARSKRNIETFDAGLELVQALNPVSYERIGGQGERQIGLIAQHVRSVLKEQGFLNSGIWHIADPDDAGSEQAVAYGQLIPVLIDAVKELAERIEDLETLSR